MSRTFNDLRNYLTSKVNASLQIDDHPALPITIDAVNLTMDYAPAVHTHGKAFNTIEHLFHHYNKYNAGKRLDASTYLKNGCQRLLQYIVFQEGSYNQLSIAQLLELSPAEWAEMPELAEIAPLAKAEVAAPVRNTVTHGQIPPVSKAARKERLAELNRRCDAIERSLREMREERKIVTKTSNNLELASNNIEQATKNVETAIRMLTNVITHTQQSRTRSA